MLLFSIGLGERFNALRKGELDLNTNLKRFNVELEASNESLDQFNYHVSHDLKTVLNNTHSLGVMIRKYNEKQDFKKIDEVVDRLLQAALSGTETVDSFLSVSSTNVGLLSSELSKINVAEQIHSILKKHELEDQVRINFEKMQFKQLNMNAQLFESLIVNLVSNSIKYCDTAPVVNLQLLEVENAKIIRYQDNGVGIDLNKHGEMLFKPFKRLLNKEGARGSGVGLHLVQRIVSASNGHIKVESTVGKGTMFVLSFLDNDQEKGPIEIKTL